VGKLEIHTKSWSGDFLAFMSIVFPFLSPISDECRKSDQ
jgi:hypothetical protein